MALVDTTYTVDNSIYLKADLADNMVGNNYYIENLQNKRNADWDYRYNKVWIEEEKDKQIEYTNFDPQYTPIDVVIGKVKTDRGEVLSDDWCKLSFKDLKYPLSLGKRYRYNFNFAEMQLMSEKEKHEDCSIWITVNMNSVSAGRECIVTRCNNSFAFVGSPILDRKKITETHLEPVAVTSELKFINIYYNKVLPIPQAELYATAQMNYFTKGIKINDRIILSGVNLEDREDNSVYKVKAVVKTLGTNTFSMNSSNNIENIPLAIIALDKDVIDEGDNFINRVADVAPMYKVVKEKEYNNNYIISLTEPYEEKILLQQEEEYECQLILNGITVPVEMSFTGKIQGIADGSKYFSVTKKDNNHFIIKNYSSYGKGKLIITCSCLNPDNGKKIEKTFNFELGGFY